jgi:hypothetical protein
MPRPTFYPGKLYSTEIGALQRVLRFATQDNRISATERSDVATFVAGLVNILSNAQSRVSRPELTTKGKA